MSLDQLKTDRRGAEGEGNPLGEHIYADGLKPTIGRVVSETVVSTVQLICRLLGEAVVVAVFILLVSALIWVSKITGQDKNPTVLAIRHVVEFCEHWMVVTVVVGEAVQIAFGVLLGVKRSVWRLFTEG